MIFGPEALLVGAVAVVGVLHTIVPDHWVPITLIARQQAWSKGETARASLQAATGHVVSTLLIASIVWLAGVAFAERFGQIVNTVSSLALIAFGGWIAISAWRELRGGHGHGHSHAFPHLHGHGHGHGHGHEPAARVGSVHGPELQRIATGEGAIELSIFEAGVPPRFRLTGAHAGAFRAETHRDGGGGELYMFANHGTYWESVEEIPEPHQFEVVVTLDHGGHAHSYTTHFTEHEHGDGEHGHGHGHDDHAPAPADDPLYAPSGGLTAVLTRHVHPHRHGALHAHWHDHTPSSAHPVTAEIETAPPLHAHRHKTTMRTALLLILGSSPMIEGIPAFFAAGKYGIGLIAVMAVVFAISTIATYMILCVYSTAGLQRVSLGSFERYGEVLSGAFIAAIGAIFWIWPVL
jgi:ABC-type nickel/cobalt efflux system permease component RcnA